MHRDGVDYVLVLLTDRRNIASGTTTIADLERRPTVPFDAALVDNARAKKANVITCLMGLC
jgi:hypothetical protein